jgi:hypothetical protein
MPSSKVEIANAALGKLAQSTTISSFTEESKSARVIARSWDRVRDFVLADHPWQFAMRSAALAQLAEAPPPGWGYRYARPADALNVFAVTTEGGVRSVISAFSRADTAPVARAVDGRAEYEIAHGEQDTSIVTDLPQAWGVFTVSIEDPVRYPPLFVEALACRLAWEIAGQIAGEVGLQLRGALIGDYVVAKMSAGVTNLNESHDTSAEFFSPTRAARG